MDEVTLSSSNSPPEDQSRSLSNTPSSQLQTMDNLVEPIYKAAKLYVEQRDAQRWRAKTEAQSAFIVDTLRRRQVRQRKMGNFTISPASWNEQYIARILSNPTNDIKNEQCLVELCPIRLDIELDGYKLRDTLTWNIHDSLVTPELFAELLCQDFELPTALFQPAISKSIKEQVEEHKTFQQMASTLKSDELSGLRMTIKLDVTVGNISVVDRFEWDLGEARSDAPEVFASQYVNELILPAEFVSAISHTIREQTNAFQRALITSGYSRDAGGLVRPHDQELAMLLMPPLPQIPTPSGFFSLRRDIRTLDDYSPLIRELEINELDKVEMSCDREARRKRRQTRGRRSATTEQAWSLRSPPRTFRTPLSYRGSINRTRLTEDDDERDTNPNGTGTNKSIHSLAASRSHRRRRQ